MYDLVCPVPGAPVPETIHHLLEMAENISVVIENPICDKYILNDLIEWGLDALNGIYEANNHTEFCQYVLLYIKLFLLSTKLATR